MISSLSVKVTFKRKCIVFLLLFLQKSTKCCDFTFLAFHKTFKHADKTDIFLNVRAKPRLLFLLLF